MKLFHPSRRAGLTVMEVIVAFAVIVVIAAIAYPVISRMRANANLAKTTKIIADLAAAVQTYASQNNGELPLEDVGGKDDWETSLQPGAEKVWYNAIPKAMGKEGLADYVKARRYAQFYTPECVLFVPGANYPDKRKLGRPYFAIAMNSRLHRRDAAGAESTLKLSSVLHPDRTVIFLEQGLPGESRSHETIAKRDYDGAPKGSGKSFVARYNGKGLIAFLSGAVKPVAAKELLDPNGDLTWSSEGASGVLWTANPKDDPNERRHNDKDKE